MLCGLRAVSLCVEEQPQVFQHSQETNGEQKQDSDFVPGRDT